MRNVGLLCMVLLVASGCETDPVGEQLRALTNGEAPQRRAAAKELAGQKDPRIAPALARAVRDPDQAVRCNAADALGGIEPAIAVPALLELLAARHAGYECTFAPLGRLHDVRALGPLLGEVARDGSPAALAAIGAQGANAVAPLVGALRKETNPQRAEAIAQTLIQAGGPSVLDPLLQLHAEFDRLAQANAVMALGLLGDQKALPVVSKAADAGIGTAPLALARIGGAGLENLVVRLDSPRIHERQAAALALAQARDPAVVPILQKGLASASPAMVEASARALLRMAAAGHPLHDPAAKALDDAWGRRDLRTIALGIEHFLAAHPDDDEIFLETIAAHGDEHIATAYAKAPSEMLRAAAVQWRAEQAKAAASAPAPQP
jgi:HEAT repeat protein